MADERMDDGETNVDRVRELIKANIGALTQAQGTLTSMISRAPSQVALSSLESNLILINGQIEFNQLLLSLLT